MQDSASIPKKKQCSNLFSKGGCRLLNQMYAVGEPIRRVCELMDLDMGLGPQGQAFNEVEMAIEGVQDGVQEVGIIAGLEGMVEDIKKRLQ